MDRRDVEACYDAVAQSYADRFTHELDGKPFDRVWLDRFAALTHGRGRVYDLGCGPGQVAAALQERGVDVVGADLSPAMVVEACRFHPAVPFERQDMLALTIPPGSLAGVVAFYAIVHFTLDEVDVSAREICRVLQPGGHILLAFHAGEGTVHVDDFLGHPVTMDFAFFQPDDIVSRLEAAGLRVEEVTMRDPYPDIEAPTRRAYILAVKP
jgi:SAM-dependent methyltransferase